MKRLGTRKVTVTFSDNEVIEMPRITSWAVDGKLTLNRTRDISGVWYTFELRVVKDNLNQFIRDMNAHGIIVNV